MSNHRWGNSLICSLATPGVDFKVRGSSLGIPLEQLAEVLHVDGVGTQDLILRQQSVMRVRTEGSI